MKTTIICGVPATGVCPQVAEHLPPGSAAAENALESWSSTSVNRSPPIATVETETRHALLEPATSDVAPSTRVVDMESPQETEEPIPDSTLR